MFSYCCYNLGDGVANKFPDVRQNFLRFDNQCTWNINILYCLTFSINIILIIWIILGIFIVTSTDLLRFLQQELENVFSDAKNKKKRTFTIHCSGSSLTSISIFYINRMDILHNILLADIFWQCSPLATFLHFPP